MPLYPSMKQGFTFGRRQTQPASRPIMVTLETDKEEEDGGGQTSANDTRLSSPSTPRRSRSPRFDSTLLSPPPHTWKSRPRTRHRSSRSQSAPPERKVRKEVVEEAEEAEEAAEEPPVELEPLDFVRPTPRRSLTAFPSIPSTRGGELIRPPPPLLRPTTFWRKTRRSGVSGPSYSPSSHLIRRSTFIAAGLAFDSPVHDLSALCVESRQKRDVGEEAPCSTSSTELKAHKTWDINYRRQVDIPQSSISNSPPSPSAVVSLAPTVVNVQPPSPTTPASPPIVQISVVPQTPNSTTSIISQSLPANATSSSPTGIISISALPPLDPTAIPSHATYPKKNMSSQQKFKMIYLVPVFVLLGILWGSLAAWLAYGCLTRRPKVQDDVLIGGPRYVPAPTDVEGRASLHQDEMQEVAFTWPELKKVARKSDEDEDDGYEDEDDPFLLPPSPTKTRAARAKSSRSTVTTHSNATCATETDNEGMKDVPWESLRHKSIKRGILAEVHKEGNRIDSLRPAGTVRNTGTGVRKTVERRVSRHGRTDSDHLIGDINHLLAGSDPNNSRPSSHRADSAITTVSLVSTKTTGDRTQWKPGAGFRIVAESPLSSRGPTPAPPEDPAPFGMSWTTPAPADRYTPAPVRHDSRSHSRTTSPVKNSVGPLTPARPHVAVLPQSPPQITSPLLENSLCFTPIPTQRALVSPVTTPTRQPGTSRKLRSPKQQPLPFPTPGDGGINSPRPDMYRGRLVKSPPKAQRPPMTSKSSSSSTTYTRDAQGRAVQAAIRKVEDIVERSWGTRDPGDKDARTLSPIGFGRANRA
ncbi:hypothetical protein DXG01_007194 [Tephrocybe rancida]|nr:hypothetical protein DXG01_007194 [Tephrocybe rancida]